MIPVWFVCVVVWGGHGGREGNSRELDGTIWNNVWWRAKLIYSHLEIRVQFRKRSWRVNNIREVRGSSWNDDRYEGSGSSASHKSEEGYTFCGRVWAIRRPVVTEPKVNVKEASVLPPSIFPGSLRLYWPTLPMHPAHASLTVLVTLSGLSLYPRVPHF